MEKWINAGNPEMIYIFVIMLYKEVYVFRDKIETSKHRKKYSIFFHSFCIKNISQKIVTEMDEEWFGKINTYVQG